MVQRNISALAACLALTLTWSGAHLAAAQGSPARTRPSEVQKLDASLRYEFEEIEKKLARSAARNTDPSLNEYVKSLGCAIAAARCTELRFYVLNEPQFNASMAPNGMMLVNSGLMVRLETESELAFVMGHEFGHYDKGHSLNIMMAARSANRSTAALLVLNPYVALVGMMAITAGVMDFSRDQEREADLFAVESARALSFDAAAGVTAWENLTTEVMASGNPKRKEQLTKGSVFNSHPLTAERIEYLRKASETASGDRGRDKAAYRAVIRPHLRGWLEAELSMRDPGATLKLLERMATLNEDPGLLGYIRGEALRLRAGDGDAARAVEAFTAAAQHPDTPPECWRQIGLMKRKTGDKPGAAEAYARYLELKPDANDRELTASIISTLKGDTP